MSLIHLAEPAGNNGTGPMTHNDTEVKDLFIIGGGINGCGIARDAAGRGLSVTLAEMNDLASATSSASTKLFHGGLRYLEYFEFRLVREALIERETLLKAMPHISWPMRFVLPYHRDMRFETDTPTSKLLSRILPGMQGRRPGWLLRFGLLLYDTLGGRKILPATRTLNLSRDAVGAPLNSKFKTAYEYSDCWIDDSRLVVLNARDAETRGADIWTRSKVIEARRENDLWHITVQNTRTGNIALCRARMLVNAGGPWVADILHNTARLNASDGVRLVRGSHIVTKKLYNHDKAYFFQGEDGRIIFAIPYETDFTLIGTTDVDHTDASVPAECSPSERDYLLNFASQYFAKPVTKTDIVWTYAGVRPLYDDGASSASAATRDYVLTLDHTAGAAPMLNIFGGKITTYRKLAESALTKITPFFPQASQPWTAGVALNGGDFAVGNVDKLVAELEHSYTFLNHAWARRLIRAYGTEAAVMLGAVRTQDDLGQDFGATLTERELRWLMQYEYACTAEDVVWRRSKLGLRLTADQISKLADWMVQHQTNTLIQGPIQTQIKAKA